MKATKVEHHSEFRIRIDFIYDNTTVGLIKQIDGARWSQSLQAWHLPYTKEAFTKLKELFPDVEYTTPHAAKEGADVESCSPKGKPDENRELKSPAEAKSEVDADIIIGIYPKVIFVKMPKNEADIQFLRSFRFARWLPDLFCWQLPNYGQNARLIRNYFNGRQVSVTEHPGTDNNKVATATPSGQPSFTKDELLAVSVSERILRIYFRFNREIQETLKQFPLRSWNAEYNC